MKILSLPLVLHLLLVLVQASNTSATDQTTNSDQTSEDYIKKSCNVTLYQSLCYSCLYPYASEIGSNPEKLAIAALNVTLSETKSSRKFVKFISRHRAGSLTPREAASLKDCIEEMSDSVYELKDSISEMKAINYSIFEVVISDVQTWVSAALTDENTCMDGFEEAGGGEEKQEVKQLVHKRIGRVARITSISLALLNLYASNHYN